MQRIEVSRQLGNNIVTRDDGRQLRKLIEQRLGDAPVVIDFEGLQITSVSFFDEALGALARRLGEEKLLETVKLVRINKFDEALARDIIASRSREAKARRKLAS
jgi:STAS-like domain of unknown function (DUF4325)